MKRYVLDASGLMAFLEDRAGAAKVEELLRKAAETQRFLFMSVVNWGEVYYSLWRTHGEAAANERLNRIRQLPIEVFDVDMESTRLAASLKARFGLPYADCFAAALASSPKAVIVTTDADFRSLGDEFEVLSLV